METCRGLVTGEDARDGMEADDPLCQMKEEDFCYHLIFSI